jgi:peptidoglycan/LPS O-acetylase OafA/YrhL
VLFFILSGFLIAASTDKKANQGLLNYLLDRAARIFSVAFPVLIIACVFCALSWMNFDKPYQLEKWWLYIPFQLAFLSQSWVYNEIPFGVNPWWSLPYEVWYYILFGGLFFLRGAQRWIFCAICLAIMGPKLWVMMPIWFAGVWLYRSNASAHISRFSAWCLLIAGPFAYLIFMESYAQNWVRDMAMLPFGGWDEHKLGYASYFGRDYVTAFFFCCHLVGAQRLMPLMPPWLLSPVRALAGISFTLYLAHPILFKTLSANFMSASDDPRIVYGAVLLSVVCAFLLAPLLEHRRAEWRRLFAFVLKKLRSTA